ncbi:MAG: SRPBCC family protein [Phycisphaerales bacterium]|nr:MAG: SRPBCC family protein [Phycisphaerales bacterium]
MRLLEDMVLTESIAIRATPEKVFRFFLNIVDDATYRAWHPEDHVASRWIKGEPWEEGSVVYAEEYLHGKLHKLKLLITKVVPNRRIEFAPLSRILRIYFPKNTFSIEPKENSCVFTATGCVRVGWLLKTFARKKLGHGLSCVKKHMQEEGENLKRILESGSPHNQAVAATS